MSTNTTTTPTPPTAFTLTFHALLSLAYFTSFALSFLFPCDLPPWFACATGFAGSYYGLRTYEGCKERRNYTPTSLSSTSAEEGEAGSFVNGFTDEKKAEREVMDAVREADVSPDEGGQGKRGRGRRC